MPETGSRFRYRYAALLRKQEWDSQVLRAERAQLQQVLHSHEAQLVTLEREIAENTQLIRESISGVMTGVERARMEILDAYIVSLIGKQVELTALIDRFRNMENEIANQLTESKKAEEMLSRMCEQDKQHFQMEANRKQYRDVDDAWLSHKGALGDKL